jgi:hypothetical protein
MHTGVQDIRTILFPREEFGKFSAMGPSEDPLRPISPGET